MSNELTLINYLADIDEIDMISVALKTAIAAFQPGTIIYSLLHLG